MLQCTGRPTAKKPQLVRVVRNDLGTPADAKTRLGKCKVRTVVILTLRRYLSLCLSFSPAWTVGPSEADGQAEADDPADFF